jgi:hypothetical protein
MNMVRRLFRATESQSPFHLALTVSVAYALFLLAFLPPGIYSIDGNSMLAVAESLVTQHSVSVPAGLGSVGVDGRTYSNWYPLLSLLSLPSVAFAHFLSNILRLPFHYVAAVFALLVQVPLTALSAGVVLLLSLRLGATRLGALLAAASFALGTIALVYARTFFAEPLLAFLVACSLYCAFHLTPRAVVWSAFLASLAVLAKPTGIFIGPVLSAYLFAKHVTWQKAILPLSGSICGFFVYAVYNQIRFGNPLHFGQPWIFSFSGLPNRLAGLLVSPGWGLIWYCPPIIVGVVGFRKAARKHFLEALAIVTIFGVFLLLHSCYQNWFAGWSWGPRYLVPTLPGLCSFTGLQKGRGAKALVVLLLAGLVINAPTLIGFYERYFAELMENSISPGSEIAWSLTLAPCIHGWPTAIRQVADASHNDVRAIFARRGEPSQRIEESRALRIVAVWWWVLPVARIPRWVGIFASTILIGVSFLILLRLFRRLVLVS